MGLLFSIDAFTHFVPLIPHPKHDAFQVLEGVGISGYSGSRALAGGRQCSELHDRAVTVTHAATTYAAYMLEGLPTLDDLRNAHANGRSIIRDEEALFGFDEIHETQAEIFVEFFPGADQLDSYDELHLLAASVLFDIGRSLTPRTMALEL